MRKKQEQSLEGMHQQDKHPYDDIINLPHHVSKRHPQMSPFNRAAQFSPFAALTGHDAAIQETARQTDAFIELDEDRKRYLDERLRLLREHIAQHPECDITYFQPDEKKNGGHYLTIHGKIKTIDAYKHRIIFTDGTAVPVGHIFSIQGKLFQSREPSDIQPGKMPFMGKKIIP